jgi:prepilin-type processing-associated H-X9-DG protein
VPASKGSVSNIFYCPDTSNIDGMDGGQTAYDQQKPQGYQDWPVQFVTAGGDGATKTTPTLPIDGFGDSNGLYMNEIRCGYWLNAYNPIGTAPPAGTPVPECTAYTQSVGFGPYANGNLQPCLSSAINRPCALIVACDGMYMGRQSVVRLGEDNRRVGYRHPGQVVYAKVNGAMMSFDRTVSNAVFADGHARPIFNNDFPHSNVPAENIGDLTILAND